MNYDEMEAGPELDALVAEKVMGWKLHPRNTAHWMRVEDSDIGYRLMADYKWSPSTDIAAAWQVLEKLDRTFKVQRNFRDGDEAWHVSTFDVAAWAPTAPLAICRAALTAVT